MSIANPLNLTETGAGEVNVPLVIIYVAQMFFAIGILWAMDYIPRVLFGGFVVLVACGYPVSYFTDTRVYEFSKDDREWTNTFLKVCLVVFLATIPMIWFAFSEHQTSKKFGRYITFVLVANILYTMLFELSVLDACAILRIVCCLLMSTSMAIRVYLLESKGQPVIYKTKKEPYASVLFTPVSTLWVFAYTLWNISYSVAAFGVRTAIQILLLYIGVGYEYLRYEVEVNGPRVLFLGYKLDKTYVNVTGEKAIHDTPDAPPLGWHFGYTRALTLGAYMALLPYIGMLPFVNDHVVTFPVACDTEVGIYNAITVALFIIDLVWTIMELVIIRGNDANAEGVQIIDPTKEI